MFASVLVCMNLCVFVCVCVCACVCVCVCQRLVVDKSELGAVMLSSGSFWFSCSSPSFHAALPPNSAGPAKCPRPPHTRDRERERERERERKEERKKRGETVHA